MREEDFVQGISMNYAQQERDLANDHTLSQPERNRIPWIIGVLVTIGVIIVVAWIIATTVASVNIVITIAFFALIAGWVPWLIERGNRHPH